MVHHQNKSWGVLELLHAVKERALVLKDVPINV
jgi:hypothetical protein